jgi:hypothetical protein
MKPTLVLGASSNPERYSFIATKRLKEHGHKVYPVGIQAGEIEGEKILTDNPIPKDVNTVTIYLSAKNQKHLYDYIFSLKPKRLIFNPGAENSELENLAKEKGIECVDACTLVMLSVGNY